MLRGLAVGGDARTPPRPSLRSLLRGAGDNRTVSRLRLRYDETLLALRHTFLATRPSAPLAVSSSVATRLIFSGIRDSSGS